MYSKPKELLTSFFIRKKQALQKCSKSLISSRQLTFAAEFWPKVVEFKVKAPAEKLLEAINFFPMIKYYRSQNSFYVLLHLIMQPSRGSEQRNTEISLLSQYFFQKFLKTSNVKSVNICLVLATNLTLLGIKFYLPVFQRVKTVG